VVGRPKVVVTTDPEKDDANSMIRYLLMSDEFDTEGLVVTSSEYHWAGDGRGTRYFVRGAPYTRYPPGIPDPCPCTRYRWPRGLDHVQRALRAYAEVYPDLHAQDAAYPSPARLDATYRVGDIAFAGDMAQASPGSDLIERVLLRNDPRTGPVFLLAWGGENTIARALEQIEWRYRGTPRWPAIHRRVSRETIIQPSGQQDDTYVRYIRPHWPGIRINPSFATGGPGGGMDYGAERQATPATALYYGPRWMRAHILGRGPLGRLYYSWGDGRRLEPGDPTDPFWLRGRTARQLRRLGYVVSTPPEPAGSFLAEGDSFTFLDLLDNGLRDDENLSWGTFFGGRYLPALMNEEAARLDWSVTPDRAAVNHPPVVRVVGSLHRLAVPGAVVHLRAAATDPDGDATTDRWYEDRSVDTLGGRVAAAHPDRPATAFTVPSRARPGQTIDMIVQVTDDGAPPLTRYARVVVTVRR
jgi:hypothetical protein